MKLPADKSPQSLYAAWWKECGERQTRECHPTDTYEIRKIERSEFISLIKQLELWWAAQ